MKTEKCLNCSAELTAAFCPSCGQKAKTSRLSFHQIVHDLQHTLLHLDKGVFKNVRTIWQPVLIRAYIAGKRVGFFNPIILLLLICGIVAFVEHKYKIVGISSVDNHSYAELSSYNIGHVVGTVIKNWTKYFEALLVLPLAFYAYLFYKQKSGYNYVENVYVMAFVVVNTSLIGLPFYYYIRHFSPVLLFNYFSMFVIASLVFFTYNFEKSIVVRIISSCAIVLLGYLSYVLALFLMGLILFFLGIV